MLLADIHAHLDIFGENERKAVVERAIAAGVKVIITNSVDPKSIRKTLELQQRFGIVKAALGLYPTEAARLSAAAIESELNFIRSCRDRIVALGEIGLDYQEAKGEKERQRQQRLFERQLELANQLGKPVIVHSRQAEKGVVATLIRCGCKHVVLHAFHGSVKLAKAAAEAGFYVAIPTNICRSSHFQAIVKELPLSRLLTETDAPYLAAEKDGKSEPAHIAAAIRQISKIKAVDEAEVANILFSNYQRLFA
ncbi:TatD family hydrolase [Candidatus Woesearchaeota archaeon]|nr:TatD family hydrolase [Candidatus Woesearchaeota archaeon]